jgi:hypothetical protein
MVTTLENLLMAPVPEGTGTYSPVSNFALIDIVKEGLDKKGMKILSERYQANALHTQMFAVYEIAETDGEQRLMVGFRNSYDKSLAVGLVSGSSVIVCSNLMLKGDIKILRKHTNGVFNDLGNLVNNTIDISYEELESNIKTAQDLKQIDMTRQEMARAAGEMFISKNLISSDQLNIMKREILSSEKFVNETRWDFYNHLTEALKKSHPSSAMQRHIEAGNYVINL